MKITWIAYSHHLNPGKYAQLAEQAARLGRVRTLVWDRYGSISGVGMSDRVIRDRWMADGTADSFGVLANRSSRNGPIATGPDCRTRTPAPANAGAESESSRSMLTYEQR